MNARKSKLKGVVILSAVCIAAIATAAEPLTQATVTEMKNTVRYKPAKDSERSAKMADVVQGADVLRTEEKSLAEIEFNNKTLARLGSKTVFSFDGARREWHAGKGIALFSVPKGAGGGRIVTSAITAAIEGTTVMTYSFEEPAKVKNAPARNGVWVFFFSGSGWVMHWDGKQRKPIVGGDCILQYADDPKLANIQEFDVDAMKKKSAMFTAFARPVPTEDEIQTVVKYQQEEKAKGVFARTKAGQIDIQNFPPADAAVVGELTTPPRERGTTQPPGDNPNNPPGNNPPPGTNPPPQPQPPPSNNPP